MKIPVKKNKENTGPVRMCVGCGRKQAKRDLLRMVRGTNFIAVDTRKILSGRGFYSCPDVSCLVKTGKKLRIAKFVVDGSEVENVESLRSLLCGKIQIRGVMNG